MPSTYSPNLRFELTATGEQSGTWGLTNNTNIGTLIEQAISGVASIAMLDADKTLLAANGSSDEARNAVITMTGALTATRNVIVPTAPKTYTVRNSTTGGQSIVVKTSAGTGVTIANGDTVAVYCDGTNVVRGSVPFNVTTGAVQTGAIQASGALTATTAAFDTMPTVGGVPLSQTVIPPGLIVMWSGSIATIPSGWALCNGTSGTPDLRDRFIIGAGGSRSPGATGGASSATTSSSGAHSHTGSTGGTALTEAQMPHHSHGVNDPGHNHMVFTDDNSGASGSGNRDANPGSFPQGPTSTNVTGISIQGAGGGQAHSHSISSDGAHAHTVDTVPPFYALAFIMKL